MNTPTPNDDVRVLLDFLDDKGISLGQLTQVQQVIDMQKGAQMQSDRFKWVTTWLPVCVVLSTTIYWAVKAESKAEEAARDAIAAKAIADKAIEMAINEGRINAGQNSDIKNLQEGIARVENTTAKIYEALVGKSGSK